MGTIDRSIATHKLILAIFRTGRTNFKHTAPWLKQLDDHDAACANATAAIQGGNLLPAAAAASGVPLDATGTPSTKHKRRNSDSVHSDGDSDPDDARGGRRSYNPAAAGFREALFSSGPVSPHVQKTLDARDNYTADLKQAKRDVLRGGQCPPFPYPNAVLSDNAVDFDKIFSARFSSTVDDGMQHRLADGIFIHVPVLRAKKRLEDQSDWQLCFNSWFDVVCFLYPHRRAELLSYLEYVMDLFASLHKSFHDRVILADVHMRNTIHGDSRASFFDRDRLQTCALRFISPWGAEAGNSTRADADNDEDLIRDEGDDFEEEFSTAEHSP
ncbi:hypothetical protein EXIGLDRAFT_697536 [Exidia glandulosa HHB12029]|uniref:Uncharacterized protein n=1 Tax=Exidia glandulosa HHB12029 TaxID=1314781 RepID=A0A165EPL5_EXIGL|nr:hypothetical protein EXIGLDRAFT_697536 [Exidia glandulosa HHB12029]